MDLLYTKNGRPLQVSRDTVYSGSGKVVGRIKGGKVFGLNGRYVGTLVRDRLVYRSTDSAEVGSPFAEGDRGGSGAAHAAGSGIWGDEPDIRIDHRPEATTTATFYTSPKSAAGSVPSRRAKR